MRMTTIFLEEIDFQNDSFRISEALEIPALEDSIRESGLCCPLLLLESAEEKRRTLVCGFRRLAALRKLGFTQAAVGVLPAEDYDFVRAYRLAISENLSHRSLTPLEQARVLHTLRKTCGLAVDRLVEDYLPMLGLKPHKNVLASYVTLHALTGKCRELLRQERISVQTAVRLSAMSGGFRDRFAGLFESLRWSASQQRGVLDLIEDLSAIEGVAAEEILARSGFEDIVLDEGLTPFQRGERLYERLYRKRYPRLSEAEERFRSQRQMLRLPGDVRVSPDPFFETPRLRVEFDAQTPERFREIAQALYRASTHPALEGMFEVR